MKKSEQEVIDILISKLGMEKKTALKKNKAYFDTIRNVMRAFNNERRHKIIQLIIKNPRTITEISKEFNIDYKAVWKHVMILEKAGMVILEKDENKKGQPVKVYHVNFYKANKEKEQQENQTSKL